MSTGYTRVPDYSSGSGGGVPTAADARIVFTTNGSGAYTNLAKFGGKTLVIMTYADDEVGTVVAQDGYSFNSGTGAITGLEASKQYVALVYA